MKFAKIVFLLAGIYGMLLVGPMFFLEKQIYKDDPVPLTHPENYYGSVSAIFAFQIVYLIISTDPVRFRPIICAGLFGKISYSIAMFWLYYYGRVSSMIVSFAAIDLVWAALFIIALRKTAAIGNKE